MAVATTCSARPHCSPNPARNLIFLCPSCFPVTAARLLREQLRLDDIVTRYEEFANVAARAHHALDLAILPDEGLARTIHDIQGLLERTGNVMLTSASSTLGTHLALTALLPLRRGASA